MADDANKDEVEKCKKIAEAAIAAGDGDKATRFLQKAKRMCPGDASIDALLGQAADCGNSGGGGGGSSPGEAEGPRFRAGHAAAGAHHRSSTPPRASAAPGGATRTGKHGNYTPEQMQLAQRILRTKDYYEILDVPKDAGDDMIKRAYKKLALKLHPDKNKAPGAEEAFKKLGKAVQCLTDEEKKQVYDRYGDEERMPQQQRRHYQQDFMGPDDIFAAFFGGAAFPQQHHQHNHHQHHPQNGEQAQRQNLLQLMPVLILILLTTAGNFVSNSGGSKFSFNPTDQYKHERTTASLDLTYYVTDDFGDQHPEGSRNLAEFERQVEIFHIRHLHSDCDHQEKTMYKKVMTAKRRGDQDELQAARRHPRPACKELNDIKGRHANIYRQAMYMGVY